MKKALLTGLTAFISGMVGYGVTNLATNIHDFYILSWVSGLGCCFILLKLFKITD